METGNRSRHTKTETHRNTDTVKHKQGDSDTEEQLRGNTDGGQDG